MLYIYTYTVNTGRLTKNHHPVIYLLFKWVELISSVNIKAFSEKMCLLFYLWCILESNLMKNEFDDMSVGEITFLEHEQFFFPF